jgi:hypothetical protein
MARVSRDRVLIVDTTDMGEDVERAEKLRDPSHVRNHGEAEWRAVCEAAGLEIEEVRFADPDVDLAAWLRRTACEGEAAELAVALLGDRASGGRLRLDRIAVRARKST